MRHSRSLVVSCKMIILTIIMSSFTRGPIDNEIHRTLKFAGNISRCRRVLVVRSLLLTTNLIIASATKGHVLRAVR
ncbi:hypothetical protein V1504DRAFT_446778 [Lipomyces starkeyi]